jgi:hypothetical protein
MVPGDRETEHLSVTCISHIKYFECGGSNWRMPRTRSPSLRRRSRSPSRTYHSNSDLTRRSSSHESDTSSSDRGAERRRSRSRSRSRSREDRRSTGREEDRKRSSRRSRTRSTSAEPKGKSRSKARESDERCDRRGIPACKVNSFLQFFGCSFLTVPADICAIYPHRPNEALRSGVAIDRGEKRLVRVQKVTFRAIRTPP